MTGSGLRLGLVLALFSFVGFESATTLGAEARNPLKTIPRAVIQSAILAGAIFIVCAYTEVLGLAHRRPGPGHQPGAHARAGASSAACPCSGLLIDIGALVSMFAGTLACITAAARVLLLMSHNGLAHGALRARTLRNETPQPRDRGHGIAAVLPVAVLAARGASGLDVYGWMGSLATYGFIVAYALGLLRAAALFARSRRLPPGSARSFLAGLRGDAAGAGRKSLSRAGRPVRQVAVHLSGLPGRRLACVSRCTGATNRRYSPPTADH